MVREAGSRIASSFALSLVVHLGLFCLFYSALGFYIFENPPWFLPEWDAGWYFQWELEWIVAGPILAVLIIRILRARTDDTWTLHRLVLRDLKKADDPRARVDSMIAWIQEAPESERSKKALFVLRRISLQGDSIGGAVLTALDSSGLL